MYKSAWIFFISFFGFFLVTMVFINYVNWIGLYNPSGGLTYFGFQSILFMIEYIQTSTLINSIEGLDFIGNSLSFFFKYMVVLPLKVSNACW